MSFSKRYVDKVVLITGGATGIGLGMSQRFAREGATVIVNSRNKKNVDDAVNSIKKEGHKAVGIPANIGKKEDRDKLIEFVKNNFKRLDVLVLSAAISLHLGPTLETTEDQYDKMFEVNVKSAFILIKGLYPMLKPTTDVKESNILILTSVSGYEPDPAIGIYAITKTALLGLTKLLAKELLSQKIRVNGIAPGLVKSKLSEPLWKGREEEVVKDMKMNRLGVPEDIASAAAFVCSEEASFMTGEILIVGGKCFPRL